MGTMKKKCRLFYSPIFAPFFSARTFAKDHFSRGASAGGHGDARAGGAAAEKRTLRKEKGEGTERERKSNGKN